MLAPLLALLPVVSAASYPLVESFAGDKFMDGWKYPVEPWDNTTSGDVFWATPQNNSLIFKNDAGRWVLKVDEGFVPYNEKRYAPKLHSKNAYEVGTVWVMDAVHMPYGCSVWGAFWTQGPDWPHGGEIDIVEGINMQKTNQIAIHAESSSCMADSGVQQLGSSGLLNCSTNFGGTGCTVNDKNDNSYGEAFAAAGGGVYVTEFAKDGIRVWFLSRPSVPKELVATTETLDTSILGTPTAYYPASSCDIESNFGPQTLTIDITLCGTWAGVPDILQQSCPQLIGTNTCYTTYVINEAEQKYKNAYFELNYINIYSTSTPSTSTEGNASQTTSGDGWSKTGGPSAAATDSNGNSAASRLNAGASVIVAALLAGLALVL